MATLRVTGDFDTTYARDMAVVRRPLDWAWLAILLGLLVALPIFASGYLLGIVNTIGITLVAVQGLGLLTGYTGQISLGQAAFMTVGGYTSALLVTRAGLSFWVALPLAALVAGVVGLIFGLPSLRIKGFYLAMATLAAQFIIPWFFRSVRPDLFGGAQGFTVPPPQVGTLALNTPQRMYFVILGVVIVSTVVAKNISRTRLGRAWVAVRDNDLAAEVLGINPFTYKLRAFFLSALYAGVAGALWAHYARHINSETFDLGDSIWFLGMIVVGGMGSTLGPIFGTIFIRLLREAVVLLTPWLGALAPELKTNALAALGPMLFGLSLILFLIFEPRGLAHRWELIKAAWQLRPFSR